MDQAISEFCPVPTFRTTKKLAAALHVKLPREPAAIETPEHEYDRAVVGSMLDYRKMFEVMVGYEGGLENADIRAINAMLSDTPMWVLKMDSAVRTIRRQMTARDALH